MNFLFSFINLPVYHFWSVNWDFSQKYSSISSKVTKHSSLKPFNTFDSNRLVLCRHTLTLCIRYFLVVLPNPMRVWSDNIMQEEQLYNSCHWTKLSFRQKSNKTLSKYPSDVWIIKNTKRIFCIAFPPSLYQVHTP